MRRVRRNLDKMLPSLIPATSQSTHSTSPSSTPSPSPSSSSKGSLARSRSGSPVKKQGQAWWQYLKDGVWIDYDSATQVEIEKSFKANKKKCWLTKVFCISSDCP